MHKVSQKFHQREVTQKSRKAEQLFLNATLPLKLISIAIMSHQDIPYAYCQKFNQRAVTQKVRKGEQFFFLHVTRHLDLIYIAIKLQDIS